MAHKLYTDALSKVQQQRRALLVQLHEALTDSTSANGRRWGGYSVGQLLLAAACRFSVVTPVKVVWHPQPGRPDQQPHLQQLLGVCCRAADS